MYNGTIDGKRYMKMLQDHLLQSLSQLKGTRTRKGFLIFQKDNAPVTIKIVKEWLNNNNIKH